MIVTLPHHSRVELGYGDVNGLTDEQVDHFNELFIDDWADAIEAAYPGVEIVVRYPGDLTEQFDVSLDDDEADTLNQEAIEDAIDRLGDELINGSRKNTAQWDYWRELGLDG